MKMLRALAIFAAASLLAANSFGGVPDPVQAPASATPGHAFAFGAWPDLAVDSGKSFPTGAIVGTSDVQVITGKSIDATEVNSGVLNIARLPALSSGSALLMGDGAGRFANVTIGSGLALVSGTLSSTVTGGVGSVFGRTGAVVAASNDYTFAQIGSKPTTLSGYGITDAQPLDADLSALAALSGTNNIYYRSASNTWTSVTIGSGLGFAGGTLSSTVIGGVSSVYGRTGAVVAASNDYSFAQIGSKPTTLSGYGITDAQPLDADLTALAALSGTNTLYYRSAPSTWSAVSIGSGLGFASGTLSNTHTDAVPSVFGRTGAVVAASNDYSFAQIGSKPTTLAGYGITDGLVVGNNLSDVPNKATGRANMGLAIGTNVQAQSADLQALAGVVTSNAIYFRASPGVWSPVQIGVNCSFVLSVLNCAGAGGGDVSSVFGRTGAVVAQTGDYTFDQVGAAPATTGTSILAADGSGGFSPVTIGSGLDFTAGTLSATGGGGAVSSVFGRTGAVVAASNDYSFAQIGSKPTTLSGYGITDAQPLDADLTALAALTGTNNLYYRSGASTWTSVTIGSGLDFTSGTLSSTATGAVSSVFGRTGAVVATSGDYSFSLLTGSAACSQMPALTGAVNSSAGSCSTAIPNGVFTNANQTFTKAQRAQVATLSLSSSTATPDFDAAQNFTLTLIHASCPCTIANPSTTPVAGQSGMIEILQSSSGSDTVSWGSDFVAAGGTSTLTLSTGASAADYLSYYVVDSTHILVSLGALNATH